MHALRFLKSGFSVDSELKLCHDIFIELRKSSVLDPDSLNPNTDPDPAFQVEPDPIRVQGFDDQNLKILVDLDPDCKSGYGSRDTIESGSATLLLSLTLIPNCLKKFYVQAPACFKTCKIL